MIQQKGSFFLLETDGTTYCFRVTEQGFLQHLYYGKRLSLGADLAALVPQGGLWPGDSSGWRRGGPAICLEDTALEVSAPGLGDLREPFAVVRTAAGDTLTDFRFESAEILAEKPPLEGLPSSLGGDAQTLRVTLTERRAGLRLELCYTAFDS